MKQTMRRLTLGLALFLANFASQRMAQSTPHQVLGINARGAKWQALTDRRQVAPGFTNTNTYVGPAVSVGSNLSILAWRHLVGHSETKGTVWYLNPLTLPGLN